jgi:hypothetical protein
MLTELVLIASQTTMCVFCVFGMLQLGSAAAKSMLSCCCASVVVMLLWQQHGYSRVLLCGCLDIQALAL